MPYTQRRACPICGKQDLLKLSEHLRQVHDLSSKERQPWLKRALFSHLPLVDDVHSLPMERVEYPVNLPPSRCPVLKPLETQPYPEFNFQHPCSMMVVGPSQCGKTHFVHQLLTHKRIAYPDKKPVMVYWFYNQWQPWYEEIQHALKNKIRFAQGLPELAEDLSNIKTSRHTILVLDDLMTQATDSPVVSKLFTQGRHRNASVILLLQNMFLKGKYNTDISRNATYKVLFRSPGDRKQIDIMAEQTFAKDRPRFMQAFNQETDQPHGYIVVDNHPRTTSEHQVVGNVFGDCYTYPYITASPPLHQRTEVDPPRESQLKRAITRKVKSEVEASPIKKRKATPVKKKVKRVKRQVKPKKKPRKQPVYKPSFIRPPEDNEGDMSYEEDDSEDGLPEEESIEEGLSGGAWQYPKNRLIARPRPRGGFGPRCSYE